MKLSITRAWDETSAFVKHEAGPLFLIAFALGVLPGIILQVLLPHLVGTSLQFVPGTTPDAGPFLAALPILLIAILVIVTFGAWGQLTISLLSLRLETVVGNAFRRAARRILPLVGASLLLVLAAIVIMVPLAALIGMPMTPRRISLLLPLFLLLWVALAARLLLVVPVAAAESVGPIGIIRRSWQLTSGHFWKMVGFLILMLIVLFVLAIVVGIVVGLLATLVLGQPVPGSLSSLVVQLITGVFQAVFTAYLLVMFARIYAQVSGNVGAVAEVFE